MRVFLLSLLFAASLKGEFTQQGARLIGVDGSAPALGTSVAISADGNTAVAGGPNDHVQTGAAWIFTRNGKVWSQQGERLVGSDAFVNEARQGSSVAISADGNTVLLGAPRERAEGPFDGTYAGATWVFTRVAGVWSQQGPKLTGTGAFGNAEQGTSVSLSANGNTAIVGGPSDNGGGGAAWIFTRSGDTWAQQAKLVGFTITGSTGQGFAVALSGDGNTAIVGGPSGLDGGSAWIFTRSEGVWSQQAQFLPLGSISAFPRFGASVALSYDGNTAIVGLPNESSEFGAAWVYVRAGVAWAQQGSALVGSTENPGGKQGTSVSLSADGNTAVIGGPNDHPQGAMWVFTRGEPGVWSQQGSKLVASDALTQFGNPSQGRSVAISADANTIVQGGSTDGSRGSVWPFVKAVPTIATFSGNGTNSQINAAFEPLTVIVRDAADQTSSNASVTFNVNAGPSGASGTFASSATVLTNASGIATAPTLTANSTIGGFTVTATTATAPSAATFNLANAALPTPTNLTATATPQLTVVLNWTPSSGATLYEIVRGSGNITYTFHATTSETFFVDSVQIISESRYFYKVRAIEPALSGFSMPAFAVVKTFTDPSLTGAVIKGVHFTELRHALHNVRAAAGLDDYTYTDVSLTNKLVKAVHLTELRAALDEALARMMLPPVLYTRPVITPGSSVIAGVDVMDLRNAVQ